MSQASTHRSTASDVRADDAAGPIAALFDEHCEFVCRVLRHHGVAESALDDSVQDVFVTAYRRWSTFEGRSSARSWLFGIARRIASGYRRRADTRARYLSSEGDGTPGTEEPFARAQAAQSLAALLSQIDRDKRTVFVLREIEGMTAPEIADALSLPVGTVYSRLRAAWSGLGALAQRERTRVAATAATLTRAKVAPERRRRMWGAVAGAIVPRPAAPAIATAGWLAQLKWAVIGGSIAAALVGARALAVHPPSVRNDESTSTSATASAPPHPSESRADHSATPPAAVAASPTTTPPPRVVAPPQPTPRAEPPPQVRPAPTATPSKDDTAATDSLADELALLRRAQAFMNQGHAADALTVLQEHARAYPQGQLAHERRRARIKALCGLKRHAEARREATAIGVELAEICAP